MSHIDTSPLWGIYYKVRMRYLHSRSIDSLKRYGTRISGIEELDKEIEKEMITTELNIDTMFEKWRSGVSIYVVNYDDTAKIYRAIHEHLIAWAEYLTTGINIGAAPLKDLIELDQFASIVYDKAISVFTKEERNTAIASNFLNVQTINFHNVLKRKYTSTDTQLRSSGVEVTHISNETKTLPQRHSLKDIFNDQINKNAIWRSK